MRRMTSTSPAATYPNHGGRRQEWAQPRKHGTNANQNVLSDVDTLWLGRDNARGIGGGDVANVSAASVKPQAGVVAELKAGGRD